MVDDRGKLLYAVREDRGLEIGLGKSDESREQPEQIWVRLSQCLNV